MKKLLVLITFFLINFTLIGCINLNIEDSYINIRYDETKGSYVINLFLLNINQKKVVPDNVFLNVEIYDFYANLLYSNTVELTEDLVNENNEFYYKIDKSSLKTSKSNYGRIYYNLHTENYRNTSYIEIENLLVTNKFLHIYEYVSKIGQNETYFDKENQVTVSGYSFLITSDLCDYLITIYENKLIKVNTYFFNPNFGGVYTNEFYFIYNDTSLDITTTISFEYEDNAYIGIDYHTLYNSDNLANVSLDEYPKELNYRSSLTNMANQFINRSLKKLELFFNDEIGLVIF